MMIYIAGPYRSDPVANTRHAIDEWEVLREAGYTAIVPHASLILDLCYPQTPEFWLAYDLKILERCDLLLRLPGFSLGADGECDFCEAHDIPVFRGTAKQFVESNGRVRPFCILCGKTIRFWPLRIPIVQKMAHRRCWVRRHGWVSWHF